MRSADKSPPRVFLARAGSCSWVGNKDIFPLIFPLSHSLQPQLVASVLSCHFTSTASLPWEYSYMKEKENPHGTSFSYSQTESLCSSSLTSHVTQDIPFHTKLTSPGWAVADLCEKLLGLKSSSDGESARHLSNSLLAPTGACSLRFLERARTKRRHRSSLLCVRNV